jgi:hypothetical protein
MSVSSGTGAGVLSAFGVLMVCTATPVRVMRISEAAIKDKSGFMCVRAGIVPRHMCKFGIESGLRIAKSP